MRKTALIVVALMALAGWSYAQGQHEAGNTGIGLIFGEPSGVSLKVWTGPKIAFDGAAAWSFVNGGSFQVHGDILFHSFGIFNIERGKAAIYYGFGGRFKTATDTEKARFSFRVPLGISYEFEGVSIELFFEVVPMLDIVPSTEASVGGGIGFRYYF